ncbi:MAG: hypothetical protein V4581_10970 [Bacteroidota bacterium]
MTKAVRIIVILCLIVFFNKISLYAQVIDRAPSGRQNFLPVEGGGIASEIDSLTPLNTLINKLNNEWDFNETGKAYWIGYTNDMFSIASHNDAAIPLLVNFFKSTQNKKGKTGALYTLHLIGINRTITGRFTEDFVNPIARVALLNLLEDEEFIGVIMELLKRDPWQSDIPRLFEIIRKNYNDSAVYPIINALERYRIERLPINNYIPDSINDLIIRPVGDSTSIPDFTDNKKLALWFFEKKYPDSVKVEAALYADEISKYNGNEIITLDIKRFLSLLGIQKNSPFNYCRTGCKIQYYVENNKLHFCTIKTASQVLNKWWADLSSEAKAKFK